MVTHFIAGFLAGQVVAVLVYLWRRRIEKALLDELLNIKSWAKEKGKRL